MPARSLAGAVHDHLEPLNSAIGCITQVPLAFQERRAASRFRADQLYTVAINNLRPVGLAGSQDVSITVGHRFRIRKASEHSDDFEAETASYFYSLLTPLEVEILTFQWTPAATTSKTFPHLHVGRAIVSDKTLILPERFHKVHVPTGHVTLAAVAWLAIEEFQIKPLTRRWSSVLERADVAERSGLAMSHGR